MLNPFQFFRTFFSLLASAGWVLLILLAVFFYLAAILHWSEFGLFDGAPKNWGESLYLSAITALTVGYGDLAPKSPVGRMVAVGLGLLGILLTGVVVAAAIKALEKASEKVKTVAVGQSAPPAPLESSPKPNDQSGKVVQTHGATSNGK